MNYYDRPEVSNSDLSELKRAYFAIGGYENPVEAFRFGSLCDAMLTDRKRLDPYNRTLLDERGQVTQYTQDDWDYAVALVEQAKTDPVIRYFVENAVGQYTFLRTLKFRFDNNEYSIRGRCKFDTIKKSIKTGADYKTTSCTSQKQFVESIFYFDYDRQGAWYMDLGTTDRHWILGISKANGQLFKFAIQRDDKIYTQGQQKYCYWSYKWLTLVENFTANETDKIRSGY